MVGLPAAIGSTRAQLKSGSNRFVAAVTVAVFGGAAYAFLMFFWRYAARGSGSEPRSRNLWLPNGL
jgi:hypothetical protein